MRRIKKISLIAPRFSSSYTSWIVVKDKIFCTMLKNTMSFHPNQKTKPLHQSECLPQQFLVYCQLTDHCELFSNFATAPINFDISPVMFNGETQLSHQLKR